MKPKEQKHDPFANLFGGNQNIQASSSAEKMKIKETKRLQKELNAVKDKLRAQEENPDKISSTPSLNKGVKYNKT